MPVMKSNKAARETSLLNSAAFKSEFSIMQDEEILRDEETMENFVDSVLITDEDINYQELGKRTIQNFRRISPHVNNMNDLMH